jgi:hypothetical protein
VILGRGGIVAIIEDGDPALSGLGCRFPPQLQKASRLRAESTMIRPLAALAIA